MRKEIYMYNDVNLKVWRKYSAYVYTYKKKLYLYKYESMYLVYITPS